MALLISQCAVCSSASFAESDIMFDRSFVGQSFPRTPNKAVKIVLVSTVSDHNALVSLYSCLKQERHNCSVG